MNSILPICADAVIEALNLEPLPLEGGYFNEIYRSRTKAQSEKERCCGTSIYYLLKSGSVSTWHQVASDEIWLYHCGAKACQVLLFPDGHWEERIIGPDVLNGEYPQSIIPAGVWQAAIPILKNDEDWGLFGAVVFPGFEFEDYRHGEAKDLMAQWPDAQKRCQEIGLGG